MYRSREGFSFFLANSHNKEASLSPYIRSHDIGILAVHASTHYQRPGRDVYESRVD